ncbi:hypothetical protein [Streptosporangium sp. NPDC000509]|uniref:hypothetical protein n=1 Tax=Streptosporangium sp. NPDC000509 TaxID=3366186 RepID=UPI0036C90094
MLTFRGAVSPGSRERHRATADAFHRPPVFLPQGGMGRVATPSGTRMTFTTDAKRPHRRHTVGPAPGAVLPSLRGGEPISPGRPDSPQSPGPRNRIRPHPPWERAATYGRPATR